ncbi:type II toxin-antitoxin system YafQ family toxin [Singulisphaera sp. GP187]|uniref:type II toxin-antitoxin system YafQ family toxin n=1 Tax=Singulisphaera sp. GP187 TaxID=1882752 RepID=UPI001C1F98FF|nr:type II toxin-antitoxin system YafQ family toxin [Singulisphaera sp. GP187]
MAKAKRPPKAKAPEPEPAPRPPLTPSTTKQFERDVARMRKRGQDTDRLRTAIVLLCSRLPLPRQLADHPLQGEWKSFRDCHLATDWVLIYQTTETELILARTGSHSDLFG